MNTPKDVNSIDEDDQKGNDKNYKLKDADDNEGIVPDDALQKVNPAAAERKLLIMIRIMLQRAINNMIVA